MDEIIGTDKLITTLIDDDLEFVRNNDSGSEYLEQLLINGFKGYNNMTLEELQEEIKARELDKQGSKKDDK